MGFIHKPFVQTLQPVSWKNNVTAARADRGQVQTLQLTNPFNGVGLSVRGSGILLRWFSGEGSRLRIQSLKGCEFRVKGFGFWVLGFEFRVLGVMKTPPRRQWGVEEQQ